MHTTFLGTTLRCGALALLLMTATHTAWSQDKAMTMLFKIITVKDDIVIGLNADELDRLGGRDAGAGGGGPRGQGRDDGLAVWGAARAEWGTAASTDAEDWTAGQQLAAGGAVHHALHDRRARVKVCMR